MFETNNTARQEIMAITSMQAVRLSKAPEEAAETQNGTATQGSAGQGLTMVQAEKMLVKLVDEGWFEKSRKGYYSLTPRALMELRQWLLETYNDNAEDDDDEGPGVMKIKLCVACREILTVVSGRYYFTDTAVLTEDRANDVPRKAVPVAYTTFVRKASGEHNHLDTVRSVRLNGRVTTSLGKRQSLHQKRIRKRNEKMEDPTVGNRHKPKKSSKGSRVMKRKTELSNAYTVSIISPHHRLQPSTVDGKTQEKAPRPTVYTFAGQARSYTGKIVTDIFEFSRQSIRGVGMIDAGTAALPTGPGQPRISWRTRSRSDVCGDSDYIGQTFF